MEKDFRKVFYSKYNSKFKNDLFVSIDDEIKSEWKYFDYKLFPLIREFNKEVKILEIGCGRGTLLEYLKGKKYLNVVGIDISREQIEIAQSKGLNAIEGDIFDFLVNSDLNFDVIFAIDFIEHFDKIELLNLFSALYNKLGDNGILIIQTPNGQAMFPGRIIYGDLTHLTIFTPGSLSQILKVTGFKEILFFEKGPVIKNLTGLIRTFLWALQKIFFNIFHLIYNGRREKILTQNFLCRARK